MVNWDAVGAVSSAITPIAVVAVGFVLAKRPASSEELLRARVEYYKVLAPLLNRIMCYVTFIGTWRDIPPTGVIDIKRRLDEQFFCAAPLFHEDVRRRYDEFMKACFRPFGRWGADAQLRTSAYQRRRAWRGTGDAAWQPAWDAMFAIEDTQEISGAELADIRRKHDALIAGLVQDLDITRARAEYTTHEVALNAHAPKRDAIQGRDPGQDA